MKKLLYHILVIICALIRWPPPDYVDGYGKHYQIDQKGQWRKKKWTGRKYKNLKYGGGHHENI
uniref:Uncharacterized protein n=1 Tax=viral metagenome TaxID=1070528 RepID=A0A6M3LQ12_9ZZZZ